MSQEIELLKEIRESVKSPSDNIEFYKTSQLAKILGISKQNAYKLMRDPSFPAICNCGDYKVEKHALFAWTQERHSDDSNDDYECQI